MRRGQVLLVVLLVLGVALTIGLAVVSRSITDVNISTTQEESARALDAAEAGVERALGGIIASAGSGDFDVSKAEFEVSTVNFAEGGRTYEVPYMLDQGDTATINLATGTNITSTSQARLCWGNRAVSSAIETVLFYRTSGGEIRASRNVFDPLDDGSHITSSRGHFVHADTAACPGLNSNNPYDYRMTVRFDSPIFPSSVGAAPGYALSGTDVPLMLQVRVLFNVAAGVSVPQRVAMVWLGSERFGSQGKQITSTGTSGSSAQELKVYGVSPDLPSMFDSVIYSGVGVVK